MSSGLLQALDDSDNPMCDHGYSKNIKLHSQQQSNSVPQFSSSHKTSDQQQSTPQSKKQTDYQRQFQQHILGCKPSAGSSAFQQQFQQHLVNYSDEEEQPSTSPPELLTTVTTHQNLCKDFQESLPARSPLHYQQQNSSALNQESQVSERNNSQVQVEKQKMQNMQTQSQGQSVQQFVGQVLQQHQIQQGLTSDQVQSPPQKVQMSQHHQQLQQQGQLIQQQGHQQQGQMQQQQQQQQQLLQQQQHQMQKFAQQNLHQHQQSPQPRPQLQPRQIHLQRSPQVEQQGVQVILPPQPKQYQVQQFLNAAQQRLQPQRPRHISPNSQQQFQQQLSQEGNPVSPVPQSSSPMMTSPHRAPADFNRSQMGRIPKRVNKAPVILRQQVPDNKMVSQVSADTTNSLGNLSQSLDSQTIQTTSPDGEVNYILMPTSGQGSQQILMAPKTGSPQTIATLLTQGNVSSSPANTTVINTTAGMQTFMQRPRMPAPQSPMYQQGSPRPPMTGTGRTPKNPIRRRQPQGGPRPPRPKTNLPQMANMQTSGQSQFIHYVNNPSHLVRQPKSSMYSGSGGESVQYQYVNLDGQANYSLEEAAMPATSSNNLTVSSSTDQPGSKQNVAVVQPQQRLQQYAMAPPPTASPAMQPQQTFTQTPVSPNSPSSPVPSASNVGNANYVKGQEYKITYTDGREVSAVWDGKYFKNVQLVKSAPGSPATPQGVTASQGTDPSGQVRGGGGGQKTPLKGATGGVGNHMQGVGPRRPLHPESDSQSSLPDLESNLENENHTHVDEEISFKLTEEEASKKRPRKPHEQGKFAVCTNCGQLSEDYNFCDGCSKMLPEEPRYHFPGKTPKLEADQETSVILRQGLVLTVPNSGTNPVALDKKVFYGAPNAAESLHSNVLLGAGKVQGGRKVPTAAQKAAYQLRLAKQNRLGKGAKGKGKKSEPEMVTISSDDEDADSMDSMSGMLGIPPEFMSPGMNTPGQTTRKQRMEDESGKVPKKSKPKVKVYNGHESVFVDARGVRIGTLRGQPFQPLSLAVSEFELNLEVDTDEETKTKYNVLVPVKDIQYIMSCLNPKLPVLFISTMSDFSSKIRQELDMNDPAGPNYYDPDSKNEAHRHIIVLLESTNKEIRTQIIDVLSAIQEFRHHQDHHGPVVYRDIDYEHANALLTRSTPPSQVIMPMRPGMLLFPMPGEMIPGPLAPEEEEEEDEDEPRDRSRSPSPPFTCFQGPIVKFFVYPPPPATGGITVTNEDLFCLNDGEFLNDVIIDFYLKYLYLEILSEVDRKRTHIFSSFFYRRLTQRAKRSAAEEDKQLTPQERRHARVRTWTRHVDLFSKDLVVIPINESAHWYLALVCFPGVREPEYFIKQETVNGETVCKQEKEEKAQEKGKEDQDDQKEEPMDTKEKPSPSKGKGVKKQPCILIFDSLSGPGRSGVTRTIREYLQTEWNAKKEATEGPRVLDRDTMRGANPRCPQQTNYSDCGVYVLQYVQSFFEDPIKDFSIPLRGIEEWFSEETARKKREELRQLILTLQKKLNPNLDYDPTKDIIT